MTTTQAPTIIFLHFLGGSSRSWAPLRARLASVRTIALDLPGFGGAPATLEQSVTATADAAAALISTERLTNWVLVGHSMGAKIATILARRAEDGEGGLEGLSRLILLAGSPPSPEPMDEDKRREMRGWFAAGPAEHQLQAQSFISSNTAEPLAADLNAAAVDDVLRADPVSWRGWLDGGSREDWAERVGILHTPALIVSGADDPLLGPQGQMRFTAPHFADSRHVELGGAKHLLPLEQTGAVAELIERHLL